MAEAQVLPIEMHAASSPARRRAGELLVDCLLANEVDTVFCVPGESFLTVLDALHDVPDRIRVIVGRHEANVANMAEAYGKLTGKPGVCFVTRGPGASHAAIALHTAFQDSTPMILFIGQVARDELGREAFQEMDYRRFFGGTAKWVTEIVDPDRVPEMMSRAFHMAINGRRGPVVISIPEDMQNELTSAAPPARAQRAASAPGAAALERLKAMLEAAERPLLILGGGGWSPEAVADIRRFAEAFALPVATGFRRQDVFDNRHRNYVGDVGIATNPALVDMINRSDLLVVVGERLSSITSAGYKLFDVPRPRQTFVHVLPGSDDLGALYEADLLINASAPDFAQAVADLRPSTGRERQEWISSGHSAYERFAVPPTAGHPRIDVARIVRDLSDRLPADAVVTNGAGFYTAFVHRHFQFKAYGGQLAPTSGAMGYGLPAALAAKIVHPDRPAVCFAGDGCFLMASQELATAAMYNLQVVVVVIDNASYGSIRGHQEKHFPGRVIATDLVSPDFVAMARAYGAYAEEVFATEEFAAAFDRAMASGKPALLTFKQDVTEVVGGARRRPEGVD